MDKATGAQIRSRVRWIEEGVRSTSYFLGVENYRQTYNRIKALVKDKVTYSDDNGILKVAQDFYSKLFTSKNPFYDDINT